jgi:hypothetical protein
MATITQTLKRAANALQRVQAFVAEGGDLKSEAATTVGLDFMGSFAEVGKQFGYEVGSFPGRSIAGIYIGKVRIELCAKSFILQVYDVLARQCVQER